MKVYNLGIEYGRKSEWKKAFHCYRRAAELGNADGMYKVGYYHDQREPKDDALAAYWYKRSAEAGNLKGMDRYGYICFTSEVPEEKCKAEYWYKRAAQAGYGPSMLMLRFYYQRGLCTGEKEIALARQWLEKAVEAGQQTDADYDNKEAAESARLALKKM